MTIFSCLLTMDETMKILPFALTALALLVSGCSSDDDPSNQAPSVILQNSYTGPENTDVTITAEATDTDGSIASYQWEVTSGDAQIVSLSLIHI